VAHQLRVPLIVLASTVAVVNAAIILFVVNSLHSGPQWVEATATYTLGPATFARSQAAVVSEVQTLLQEGGIDATITATYRTNREEGWWLSIRLLDIHSMPQADLADDLLYRRLLRGFPGANSAGLGVSTSAPFCGGFAFGICLLAAANALVATLTARLLIRERQAHNTQLNRDQASSENGEVEVNGDRQVRS